ISSPQVCSGDGPTLASTLQRVTVSKVTTRDNQHFIILCGSLWKESSKPEGLNTDSDVFCPDIVFRELYSSPLWPGSSAHKASFYPAMIQHRSWRRELLLQRCWTTKPLKCAGLIQVGIL